MAKQQKRGFFSWFGLGNKTQPAEPLTEQAAEQTTAPADQAAQPATQPPAACPQPASLASASPASASTALQTRAQADNSADTPATAITPPSASAQFTAQSGELPDAATPAITNDEPSAPLAESATSQTTLSAPSAEQPQPAIAVATPADSQITETACVAEPAAAIAAQLPPATAEADENQLTAATINKPAVTGAELSESALSESALSDAKLTASLTASSADSAPPASAMEPAAQTPASPAADAAAPARQGFFNRLKRSLIKTRQNLGAGFISLFRGKKIDDELFEELEEQLLIADVGVETTSKIIRYLTDTASRKQLQDASALYNLLKEQMSHILQPVDQPLALSDKKPFVLLMVGVNGVGKTTTIGKLAHQFRQQGKSVMLAAGDTFRAAAVEQLQSWGERNQIPVVAQHTGADSASVIFDAIAAAQARNIDVLIADTAGRLQNKAHLMEELKKIVRVMKKLDVTAPHEIMLTLDASTGQNAVSQTRLFHEAVGLTGITLSKLDGTAKGGVIFSLADQFAIPLRYIGVGEGIDDLRPFNAAEFIDALFAREDNHDPL